MLRPWTLPENKGYKTIAQMQVCTHRMPSIHMYCNEVYEIVHIFIYEFKVARLDNCIYCKDANNECMKLCTDLSCIIAHLPSTRYVNDCVKPC